jgi:hypothetical protein
VEDPVFTEKPVGAARAEGSTGKLEVHGVGRDSRNFQGGHPKPDSSEAALQNRQRVDYRGGLLRIRAGPISNGRPKAAPTDGGVEVL